MIQLLKTYIELGHLSMHNVQTMNIHQKTVFFFVKAMKEYLKAIILLVTIYENILNFNFLMGGGRGGEGEGGIRRIDCFHRFMKWSFINVKNDEVYGNL